MTNDLFTPPERRPAPEHLRTRILDEIADEADPSYGSPRARRWMAPLVACGVALASATGALALRDSRPMTVVDPTSTTVPLPAADASALADRCASTAKEEYGFTGRPMASPSRHTVLVPFRVGDSPSQASSGIGAFILCAGDGSSQKILTSKAATGPNGVVVASHQTRSGTVVGLGGPLPKGYTHALLAGSESVTARDGLWVSDRMVADGQMQTQPDAMGVGFDNTRLQTLDWTVPWPGGGHVIGPVGQALRDSCEEARQPGVEQVLELPSGHALFVARRDGSFAVCDGSSSTSGTVDQNGIYQATSYASWATGIDVMGGTLPGGVTGVEVRTPRGVLHATVQGRVWAIEDLVLPSQTLMEPEHVRVEMTGPRPRGFWAAWKEIDGGMRSRAADSLQGFLTRDALRTTCQVPAGDSAPASMGGHVVLDTSAGHETVCSATVGFAHRFDASAHPGVDAQTFALHKVAADSGAVLLIGGGRLPKGITGVTFISPDGSVPATIKDGSWVHEHLMLHPTAGQTPTAVHLAGPGLDRTVPLS